MDNKSGRIIKKKTNFSMISNTLALDPTISAKAKGIYLEICVLLNKVNFIVYKSTAMKYSSDGEAAFESGWKELKDHGYLIVHKYNSSTGFKYEYELLDEPLQQNNDETSKEEPTDKTKDYCNSPDPENRGVGSASPDRENPGLGNQGLYIIPEKRNTREYTYSSSSSINTPREESKPIPLSDDDEKEINHLTLTLFKKREGKRLSTLPLKHGCDGNMIYPALKIALENGAVSLVGYLEKLFKDWESNDIRHLSDLGIDKITTKEEVESLVSAYKEQLDYENDNPRNIDPEIPDFMISLMEKNKEKYFKDRSEDLKALAKLYSYDELMNRLRKTVIDGRQINEAIKYMMNDYC